MTGSLRIGVLQMRSGIVSQDNARAVAQGVRDLAAEGARIVFTPEMSGLLDRDRARLLANTTDEAGDPTLAAARRAARQAGVWVQLGSLAIRPAPGADRLANRAFLIDPDGGIAARYDKIHLFDVDLGGGERYRESATFMPGAQAMVARTPWGPLGLSICYDMRFPELYRALAETAPAMIAVPAAFTRPTGEAHWHTLLRARAIESGAFVIAAAQSGVHADGRETFGHSLVVDPWGAVLLDMGDSEGGASTDLDLDAVDRARTRLPTLAHRRTFSAVTR